MTNKAILRALKRLFLEEIGSLKQAQDLLKVRDFVSKISKDYSTTLHMEDIPSE